MMGERSRLIARALGGGIFFGLLWGAWAYYVNSDAALRAAVTQFTLSFLFTAFFSATVDGILMRTRWWTTRLLFGGIAPVVVMATTLGMVHLLRGTPNILVTITPSSSIALLYSVWRAWSEQRRADQREPGYISGQGRSRVTEEIASPVSTDPGMHDYPSSKRIGTPARVR